MYEIHDYHSDKSFIAFVTNSMNFNNIILDIIQCEKRNIRLPVITSPTRLISVSLGFTKLVEHGNFW